jgi:hypothetical protein
MREEIWEWRNEKELIDSEECYSGFLQPPWRWLMGCEIHWCALYDSGRKGRCFLLLAKSRGERVVYRELGRVIVSFDQEERKIEGGCFPDCHISSWKGSCLDIDAVVGSGDRGNGTDFENGREA